MTLWDYNNAQFSPSEGVWIDCPHCGGSGELEDECTCGDDCCCCADPVPPMCTDCRGKGGWWVANGREVNDSEQPR